MDAMREYIKQCWLIADDALAYAEVLEGNGEMSKSEVAKVRTLKRKAYKLYKSYGS